MDLLPLPPKEALIYEDSQLYICMASFPLTKGHCVIVWKNPAQDIHLLTRQEYLYLMEKVDVLRNALLETLNVEKVYLLYMDETKQVHWHLVPRYDEQGTNVLMHEPKLSHDFSLVPQIKKNLSFNLY